MKKTFEEPEMKVIEIEDVDVICASGCQSCPAGWTPVGDSWLEP